MRKAPLAGKGKIPGAEIDRLLELRDLFVRKVGRGHFLLAYKGKWAQAAIDRQARAHLRTRPKQLDAFDDKSGVEKRNIRAERAMAAKVRKEMLRNER